MQPMDAIHLDVWKTKYHTSCVLGLHYAYNLHRCLYLGIVWVLINVFHIWKTACTSTILWIVMIECMENKLSFPCLFLGSRYTWCASTSTKIWLAFSRRLVLAFMCLLHLCILVHKCLCAFYVLNATNGAWNLLSHRRLLDHSIWVVMYCLYEKQSSYGHAVVHVFEKNNL